MRLDPAVGQVRQPFVPVMDWCCKRSVAREQVWVHQLKPIVYWEGKEAFLFDQDLFFSLVSFNKQ